MTFDPYDLDLPKNEPLNNNSGVKLHPPTKFHPNWTQDLKNKLIFDPNDLDLNEPLKGNSGVNLHSPTEVDEGQPKDAGGVEEQTDRRLNNL